MFARYASLWALLLFFGPLSPLWCQDATSVAKWQQQLRDPSASYRAQAALELARLGPAAAGALDSLYERLGDLDANVRLNTIHALGVIGGRPLPSAEHLLPLLDDDNEHVRYTAEWALARLATLPVPREDLRRQIVVFRQAVESVQSREHHQRHRLVVEDALQQWSDVVEAEEAERRRQEAEARRRELANQRALEAQRAQEAQRALDLKKAALQRLTQSFDVSNTADQLRIIDQLATLRDDHLQTAIQEARVNVLKQAILRSETFSVHFAIRRWGEQGQQAIQTIFDSLPADVELADWTSEVLAECTPRDREDVHKLIRIAAFPQNADAVRLAALEALQHSPTAVGESIRAMLQLLENRSEDRFFRADVMDRLGGLLEAHGSQALPQELAFETAEARLLDVLRDFQEDWYGRSTAASVLSRFAPNSQQAANAFERAVRERTPADHELRTALQTLAAFQTTGETSQELIVRALSASDDLTRIAGAQAACAMGMAAGDTTALLIERLCDADECAPVKTAAASALSKKGPQAVAEFGDAILNSHDAARLGALHALATLGPDARPALTQCMQLLEDQSAAPQVRSAAALAIGSMGARGSAAADALDKLVRSGSSDAVRASAVLALAEVGEMSGTELHHMNLSEEDSATRVAVAVAEHRLDDPHGIDALVAMLTEDDSTYAANALQDIGQSATGALLRVLQDTTAKPESRVRAMEILVKIPQDDYLPLLAAVSDEQIGGRCAQCVSELFLNGNAQLLDDLVVGMRGGLGEQAVPRFEDMAVTFASGVGAGGEDEDRWPGSKLASALTQGTLQEVAAEPAASAEFALTMNSSAGSEHFIATGADLPPALDAPPLQENVAETDMANEPAPAAASTEEANEPAWESPSENAPWARQNPLALAEKPSDDQDPASVTVFYGTNRAALPKLEATPVVPSGLPQKILAVLAAIATIAVCLFGFLRHRSWVYSLFAVAGLVLVAWFGFRYQRPVSAPEVLATTQYGNDYSEQLSLGTCTVSIPPGHVTGELESPSVLRLEFRQDASKHVVLEKTIELDDQKFFERLDSEMDAKGDSLLVFIHGYNVSFEDAARRTAQMSHDLKYPGASAFYSWPSQGNWYHYQRDKKNIQLSVGLIKQFLLRLAEQSGAKTINLVAHSMGNVGLTAALAEIEPSGKEALFNQVVLAAPDIDADIFKTRIAPSIVGKADRCTLYTSSTDLALVASRYFNSGRRAGETSQPITPYPGIDLIDATAVDSSLLGHTYYGGSISVLHDLGELLMDQPIERRAYLKTAESNGHPYWFFDRPNVVR